MGSKLIAKSLPFLIDSSPRAVLELLVTQKLKSLLHNTLWKSKMKPDIQMSWKESIFSQV